MVDLKTSFCVFPRVIIRGDADLIELPGTERFHFDTAGLSGWEFRVGYAGDVFDPPVAIEPEHDADDVTVDLIPRGEPR